MSASEYLLSILAKYKSRNIPAEKIAILKNHITNWANGNLLEIKNSGSIAKGTAISIASDLDLLVSINNMCTFKLKQVYESLYSYLALRYSNIRKQNVSVRINIGDLIVDVTPAKKQIGNTNNHSLYVSKADTWKQTNIQTHISDISTSHRTNDIKLLKIWRELNNLDFPSIYLEYLLVKNILAHKPYGSFYLWDVLGELAKNDNTNPLFAKIVDPANTNNILSDLLTLSEKRNIILKARESRSRSNWSEIVW